MIGCIILARPDSKRLPDKHNRYIGQKTLLSRVIDRVNKFSDFSIIATTHDGYNRYDNYYISTYMCPKIDDNNVVGRIKEIVSGGMFDKVDTIVTICGDCPLIDSDLVKQMIKTLEESDADYVKVPGNHSHEGISVFKKRSTINLIDGEHLSLAFNNLKYVETEPIYQVKFRASVDNHADLAFMRECYNILKKTNKEFTHKNVVELINVFSEVLKINRHVNQKNKDFEDSQPNVAIITEGNDSVGMGHIARSIGLAQEYNECQHKHVEIYINDNLNVKKMLNKYGYEENLDYFVGVPTIMVGDMKNWLFIHDKKSYCTLDYTNIYAENPTFAVNKRLNYILYGIDSNVLISFGMGEYSKYSETYLKLLNDQNAISVSNVSNFENYLYGTDKVITMWSTTAREAIFLGKHVECFSANKVDDELCTYLENRGIIKWLGNINILEKLCETN